MLPSPPAESDHRLMSKRKYGDIQAEESRDCSFQLENLSDGICLAFAPITKLLRAHLPLSWLAASSSTDIVPSGSLLKGPIYQVTTWEYSILVVRSLPNGGLYALEKVDHDCFVLHALQPFVSEIWIQNAAVGAASPVNLQMMLHYLPAAVQSRPDGTCSRRTPSISSDIGLKIPKNRRGVAARLSILSQSTKHDSPSSSPGLDHFPAFDTTQELTQTNLDHIISPSQPVSQILVEETVPAATDHSIEAALTSTDMLSADYLRQRYLETLYTVRSSLAYYTKGPLSRARARARMPDASMNIHELATFYRDSILPVKKLDLKYRQSIRHCIASGLHESACAPKISKRPKKKTRLGKDALWPAELDYVRKWWSARVLSSVSNTDQESVISDLVASLRMREAQMQITLILEVLAIEAKQFVNPAVIPCHPDVKAETVESDALAHQPSEGSSKKRNLETDLEILADKLCIWHSVGLEHDLFSTSTLNHNSENDDSASSRDRLRDFCTDVLIPFYSSKLPLICKSLCKTLAGPELFDQAAKSMRLKVNTAMQVSPGASIKRRPASRDSITDKSLNEAAIPQLSPPTLLRSATLPPIPRFRRADSELSARQLNRQSSLSFTSREVDLVADAHATASKKRKLDLVAVQKQELATAIQALKKPNRQNASKSYMDDLECRKADLAKPVLITATPHAIRKKSIIFSNHNRRSSSPKLDELVIPSSGVKVRSVGLLTMAPTSSSKKRAVVAALRNMPRRESIEMSDLLDAAVRPRQLVSCDEALADQDTDPLVFDTPSKSKVRSVNVVTIKRLPSRQQNKENTFCLDDLASKTMDRAMNMTVEHSIYDQLGWNNDEDI